MKKLIKFAIILSFTICLSSCTDSPFKPVENPSIPIERPGYSILPPAGDDWRYYTENSPNKFQIYFVKTSPDSKFHTYAVGVIEIPNPDAFENPQEFERWAKREMEMIIAKDRLLLLDKKIEFNLNPA